jgi:hypothetical protein
VKEAKVNHETGEDIKKDVGEVITEGIKFPEMIIYGIT